MALTDRGRARLLFGATAGLAGVAAVPAAAQADPCCAAESADDYSGPSGKADRPEPAVGKQAEPAKSTSYSGPSGGADRPQPVTPEPSYSGPSGGADRPQPVVGKQPEPATPKPAAKPRSKPKVVKPESDDYAGPSGREDRPEPVLAKAKPKPKVAKPKPKPKVVKPESDDYSGPAGKEDRPEPVVPEGDDYAGPSGKEDRPEPAVPDGNDYSGPAGGADRPAPILPDQYSGPAGKKDRPNPVDPNPDDYTGPSGKKDRPDPVTPGDYSGPSGKADRPGSPPQYVIQIGNKPDLGGESTGYRIAYPTTPGQRNTLELGCSAGRGGPTRNGMTVACSGVPKGLYKGRHRAPAPGKTGPTLDVTVTRTAARTPNVVTPEGETASLQVTTETTLSAGAEARLKELDVSVKRIAKGNKVTYQITGTPDRIDKIANDPSLAPKAGDPTTIRKGDGILISDENFQGGSGKASAYNVSVEATHTDGKRKSAGVQRIDGRTIRVTVGDDDVVRTVLKAGVGNDVASVGIWHSSESTEGDFQQVDLNVSTKEGWDAYQEFLATGRVAWRPSLIYATGGRQTWNSSGGFYAKVGPVEASTTGTSQTGDSRQLEHNDGSVEQKSTETTGDLTFSYGATTRPDGSAGPPVTSITLQNVESDEAREYGARTGGNGGTADGNHDDVRIDFTSEDLANLRELAIKRIQRVNGQMPDVSSSRRDIVSGSSAAHPNLPQVAVEWNIVNAQTPAARLYALYKGQGGHSNEVLRTLRDWHLGGGPGATRVPGHETILKD